MIVKAEKEAKNSNAKFSKIKKELSETREKIEEYKKNPPNRTGESLLESIKNKTKQ
jgi:F0F1-type ATP synthase membrane subunit b/b'